MRKVILTRGLPASGKSSWAKSILREHPNEYKIVCKDDLRAMLDNHHRSDKARNQKAFQKREKLVLNIRDFIILESLRDKYSVIVADTNLSPKHESRIRDLVRRHNKETGESVCVEIKDFTDVPLEECIRRDLKREDSVGEAAIRQMYQQFVAPQPETLPIVEGGESAIIVDMDGTLCYPGDRNPYDASTADKDEPNYPILDLVKVYQQTHKVFIVTGRSEKDREPTERWLTNFGVVPCGIFMRPDDDNRKDYVVKEEVVRENLRGKYNIAFALDDRDGVIDMYRRMGISAWQVNSDNCK